MKLKKVWLLRVSAFLVALSFGIVSCGTTEKAAQSPPPAETPTAAAGSPTASNPETQTNLVVATTVAPITNIVSNVAGTRVRVIGIVPEGTDSHTFEPRPSDGQLLGEANLIFVNGLGLEEPTMKLAESVKQPKTEVYQLGTNTIQRQDWVFDNSFPETGGKPNPHLWVNPQFAGTYAKLAAAELSKVDPEGADYYAANLKAYLERLDALDAVTREVVASIPAQNRNLLTYHDSWPYWAKQYGFEVIGAIQPSDFNEPSAQEVASLIDQIRETKVPAIFGSEVFPSNVEEQIANEARVKLANTSDDDLPGDGTANALENSDPKHTYIGMMADNLRILAENLGGDPSLVDQLDTRNVVGPTANTSTPQ